MTAATLPCLGSICPLRGQAYQSLGIFPHGKNGEGILATVGPDHLVCYSITPRSLNPRTVMTNDQFGPEQLKVIGPRTVCVPSVKREIAPPPPDDDDSSGSGGHGDSDSDGADD